MAVIWMDGPDHYGTNAGLLLQGAYAEANHLAIQANSGPGGVGHTFSIQGTVGGGGGYQLRWVMPHSRTTVGLGARFFLGSLPNGDASAPYIYSWRDAANNYIATLQITSTGALRFTMAGGAVFYTSDPIIVAGSWQHIEAKLILNGADGGYAINVNGLPVVNVPNGVNLGAGPIAQIGWGLNPFGGGITYNMRDIYVWDNSGAQNNSGMQGDRQIITSFADADGPEQDWKYSAGASGWPLISNNPPVDTQYVFADTAGNLSDFQMDDIDTDITSISAIRLAARAWKSDAGIGTLSLGVVSAGSKSAVVEQALSTEPIYYSQIVELDPHTGARFSPTGLNAALAELNRVQ